VSEPDTAPSPAPVAGPRLHWWREVIYILVVYAVYSRVRNNFGSAGGRPGHAASVSYGHALDVIHIERNLHLFLEPTLQSWYLDLPAQGFIQFWNLFYGTAHFILTGVALIWLFRADPARYPLWRNTLAFTTVAALIGFAAFSLMPPRLLDEPPLRYGPPASEHNETFGLVDTLAAYPTLWSFESGSLKKVSNQYAAMPSLHMAWSTWSALVLLPLVGRRRRWARALVIAYPFMTLFTILVTANHFWLDALGGLATLGVGYLLARPVTTFWEHRAEAKAAATAA
jgi:hypothetical protein